MNETSARDDLAWIRSIVDQSHRYLCGTWRHQAVWGVLAAVGLVATWIGLEWRLHAWIPWTWLVVLGAGWSYSLLLVRRGSGRSRVRSVASRTFGGIWMALGATLTILTTTSVLTGAIDPRALTGLVAIVLGAGYFASGFIADLRWLLGVALAWWVGGLFLLLWARPDALLVLAAMTLVLEVGPALHLRRLERRLRDTPVGG